MTGPNVPVSGPKDGARDFDTPRADAITAVHRYLVHVERAAASRDADASAIVDLVLSVVADTTAGEADLAEGRRLVANVLSLPEAHQIEAGADLIARSLAARSGGAQDDGLRGVIVAVAEWLLRLEAMAAPDSSALGREVCRQAALLRRALTYPDDARQDGAR